MKLQDYYKPISVELLEVQQKITEQYQVADKDLSGVLQEISRRQGKLLRPAFVLLSGKLISDIRPEHIDLAAVVELVHRASLLHDDVIDKAQLRRGQVSANALWGNTAAVLLGDFLLSRAFMLGTSSQFDGTVRILCQTAQTLCTGELKQNLLKGSWSLTEQDYFQIIEAKTAALFRCSCQLGAMASAASAQQIEALSEFGFQYGLAFQIADDLRDILSTENQEGKTLGTDLLEKKLTLPAIHWINQDDRQKQALIEQMTDCSDAKELARQMRLSGSIDYAIQLARQCIEKARQQLDMFNTAPAKEALLSLADNVISDIT
ncbi:MAG: polyprenyl synthetase family protein [Planctomycetota bacterium]